MHAADHPLVASADRIGTTRGSDFDMEQRRQIKQFVLQNFLFSDNEDALNDQDSLIRDGIVDSTGIHELILFLEENFQLSVTPDEMTPANFDSIESVDGFVTRKRAG